MGSLILTFLSLLLLSIAINYDDRRPISAKIKYKFRVKDNSFFKKIFKLKVKCFKTIPKNAQINKLIFIIKAINFNLKI